MDFLYSAELRNPDHRNTWFSVTTPSNGRIVITVGYDIIHVWKYTSVHHPVVHMLLFAEMVSGNTFKMAKSMVLPKNMIGMFKKSSYSTSPKIYQAGWAPAKSRNVASPEEVTVGRNWGSSEASLPVLLERCNHRYLLRGPIIVSLAAMGSMISDFGCDLNVRAPVESPHEQIFLNKAGGSNENTSNICSAHKGVQRQIHDSEPENHSDLDSGVGDHHTAAEVDKKAAIWLIASGATCHMAGNRKLLSHFKPEHDRFVQAGDGELLEICGRGSVITDAVVLPNVFFVPGLTNNLVSASQLTELEYCLGFARGSCFIRRMNDSTVVGKASLGEDGLFQLDYLKVPLVN